MTGKSISLKSLQWRYKYGDVAGKAGRRKKRRMLDCTKHATEVKVNENPCLIFIGNGIFPFIL